MLPPIALSTYQLGDGRQIHVVRDDRVPGGTKQRVLERILKPGVEYVYGGPRYGYAQIGLAIAAKNKHAKATLFVAESKVLHERTARALKFGAKIKTVPNGMLTVVLARAREYAKRQPNCSLLPEGFDYPEFLSTAIELVSDAHLRPTQVWCVISTGMLYRSLLGAWPWADFRGVQVGMVPRLDGVDKQPTMYVAPEKYQQDAKLPPPYPSCSNSDAKVWRFVEQFADDHALVWNVAK